MNFVSAIKILKKTLKEKQPKTFSTSWIVKETPSVYRYLCKNVRTENDDIDWDRVTGSLDRYLQKKFVRYRRRLVKSYEDQIEVDRIMEKYKDKLYVFINANDEKDKKLRNIIIIKLVRIAQKGNILAQKELSQWLKFMIDDWVDRYPQIWRWRGYSDPVEEKIISCVRNYRYTGTFIGYLFKTLEYSAYSLKPLYSLDDPFLDGSKSRIDYVIVEQEESYS